MFPLERREPGANRFERDEPAHGSISTAGIQSRSTISGTKPIRLRVSAQEIVATRRAGSVQRYFGLGVICTLPRSSRSASQQVRTVTSALRSSVRVFGARLVEQVEATPVELEAGAEQRGGEFRAAQSVTVVPALVLATTVVEQREQGHDLRVGPCLGGESQPRFEHACPVRKSVNPVPGQPVLRKDEANESDRRSDDSRRGGSLGGVQ